MAQLFGEECANPGTIGWLSAASPLCVTSDGAAKQSGGIVFADLPANILGSFFMGAFQSAEVLGITIPMAVAWLAPSHAFQKMTILHKAITTGFCGSLTTFSSWNSEMVVLIFGTGFNRQSQIVKAILGYIIGMETALGSFACGKSVAVRIFRWINPVLSAEMDASKERIKQGIPVNPLLPDFERRFLPNMNIFYHHEMEFPTTTNTEHIASWRDSTESVRRIGHVLLPVLTDIETKVLAHNLPLSPDLEALARAEGWDVESLLKWRVNNSEMMELEDITISESRKESIWFTLPVAVFFVVSVYTLLFLGLLLLKETSPTTITYRTMVYSMIFAPFGAILRWRLSILNGNFCILGWEWLPFGTFLANFIGSIVSIATIATEYRRDVLMLENNFWIMGTSRAIRVGFAGCLTTVSTFAAEVTQYMHSGSDHGYPYILTTLVTCCLVSCMVYGAIAPI